MLVPEVIYYIDYPKEGRPAASARGNLLIPGTGHHNVISHPLNKLHNRRTLGHDDLPANIFYIVLHIEDVAVYINLKR